MIYSEYDGNFNEDIFEFTYEISVEDECAYQSLTSKKDHEVKINGNTYTIPKGKVLGTLINKYNYKTVEENSMKVGLKITETWAGDDGLMLNIGLEKEN